MFLGGSPPLKGGNYNVIIQAFNFKSFISLDEMKFWCYQNFPRVFNNQTGLGNMYLKDLTES